MRCWRASRRSTPSSTPFCYRRQKRRARRRKRRSARSRRGGKLPCCLIDGRTAPHWHHCAVKPPSTTFGPNGYKVDELAAVFEQVTPSPHPKFHITRTVLLHRFISASS